jgi:membrane protease YdiL (CAAX protease family)
MKNKETLITAFFIIISLIIYALFPTKNTFQQFFTLLIFFVLFPLIFNWVFLKKKLSFYGLNFGSWREGLVWSGCSLILIFIIFLMIFCFSNFFRIYKIPTFVLKNFGNFLFYELVLVIPFVMIYEFYFRGFLMFVFESKFKYWAILIQSAVFLVLILSIRDLPLSLFLPYLIFAPFAGYITYKSRSIVYSLVLQFLIILSIDAIVLRMIS